MNNIKTLIEYLQSFNLASTCLRMLLACLMGGILGLDRERNHHVAGLRTYYAVCLGATVTVLLSQYLYFMLNTQWAAISAEVGITTDVSRLGAQVINGIGFLGAGAILVTSKHQIRGLTTAAGLWSCACLGIAIGSSFYELALCGFLIIWLSLKALPIIGRLSLDKKSLRAAFAITVEKPEDVGDVLRRIRAIEQITVNDCRLSLESNCHMEVDLITPMTNGYADFVGELSEIPSVLSVRKMGGAEG